MNRQTLILLLALLPLAMLAQEPIEHPTPVFNYETRTVLLANRPAHLTEAQWLEMMQQPVNWSSYPLRITPGMQDTLDMRALDKRFKYEMAPQR